MYRQLLHTADISPFDIIVLFFWQAQWARSIISAVLFLFHWVHTLTMVTFLNGSTCALPILYNNLQPILTSVTTSWCDIMWQERVRPTCHAVHHLAYVPSVSALIVSCPMCLNNSHCSSVQISTAGINKSPRQKRRQVPTFRLTASVS